MELCKKQRSYIIRKNYILPFLVLFSSVQAHAPTFRVITLNLPLTIYCIYLYFAYIILDLTIILTSTPYFSFLVDIVSQLRISNNFSLYFITFQTDSFLGVIFPLSL